LKSSLVTLAQRSFSLSFHYHHLFPS